MILYLISQRIHRIYFWRI